MGQKDMTEIKHVDAVLKLLSVFGNSQEFENLVQSGEEKEVRNMCEAIEKIVAEGKAKSLLENIANLQKNMEWSLDDALKAIGKTAEDYEKAKMLVK